MGDEETTIDKLLGEIIYIYIYTVKRDKLNHSGNARFHALKVARFPRTIEHVDIGSRCINPARRINRLLSFAKERSLLNVPRVATSASLRIERTREVDGSMT